MMDPHFIFNVINSIQYFVNTGKIEEANVYLAEFAKLIRICTGFSVKNSVLLEEEIAYLQLYLKFEKLRFGEDLTYEIIVNPALQVSEIFIAVMMIQPFLENAIWHGILPMNAKGHLKLEVDTVSDSLIKIRVTDDGVGISEVFICDNLLARISESHVHCTAIERLKIITASSTEKLYVSYSYLNSKLVNKGTVAEFLLPVIFN